MKQSKNLLVISGHDPTGGAGIQADIEVSRNFNIKVFLYLHARLFKTLLK